MDKYLATQTREITIEAPSAAVARQIAETAFVGRLKPSNIVGDMTVSNITINHTRVEKIK